MFGIRRFRRHVLWALSRIENRIIDMTQATDDLTAAFGDLSTAVTASNAEIDALVAKLAQTAPDDSEAVEGIVSQIKALTQGVNDKLASVNPAPAPTPVDNGDLTQ